MKRARRDESATDPETVDDIEADQEAGRAPLLQRAKKHRVLIAKREKPTAERARPRLRRVSKRQSGKGDLAQLPLWVLTDMCQAVARIEQKKNESVISRGGKRENRKGRRKEIRGVIRGVIGMIEGTETETLTDEIATEEIAPEITVRGTATVIAIGEAGVGAQRGEIGMTGMIGDEATAEGGTAEMIEDAMIAGAEMTVVIEGEKKMIEEKETVTTEETATRIERVHGAKTEKAHDGMTDAIEILIDISLDGLGNSFRVQDPMAQNSIDISRNEDLSHPRWTTFSLPPTSLHDLSAS